MRRKGVEVVAVFADGTTMSGEELLKNGKVIYVENNLEVNNEVRRLFHPELVAVERLARRRTLSHERKNKLLAELEAINKEHEDEYALLHARNKETS